MRRLPDLRYVFGELVHFRLEIVDVALKLGDPG
jgi:hypothetical protein